MCKWSTWEECDAVLRVALTPAALGIFKYIQIDLHLRLRNLHGHQSEQLDACGARHLGPGAQDLHANQSDRPGPIALRVLLGHLAQIECVHRRL